MSSPLMHDHLHSTSELTRTTDNLSNLTIDTQSDGFDEDLDIEDATKGDKDNKPNTSTQDRQPRRIVKPKRSNTIPSLANRTRPSDDLAKEEENEYHFCDHVAPIASLIMQCKTKDNLFSATTENFDYTGVEVKSTGLTNNNNNSSCHSNRSDSGDSAEQTDAPIFSYIKPKKSLLLAYLHSVMKRYSMDELHKILPSSLTRYIHLAGTIDYTNKIKDYIEHRLFAQNTHVKQDMCQCCIEILTLLTTTVWMEPVHIVETTDPGQLKTYNAPIKRKRGRAKTIKDDKPSVFVDEDDILSIVDHRDRGDDDDEDESSRITNCGRLYNIYQPTERELQNCHQNRIRQCRLIDQSDQDRMDMSFNIEKSWSAFKMRSFSHFDNGIYGISVAPLLALLLTKIGLLHSPHISSNRVELHMTHLGINDNDNASKTDRLPVLCRWMTDYFTSNKLKGWQMTMASPNNGIMTPPTSAGKRGDGCAEQHHQITLETKTNSDHGDTVSTQENTLTPLFIDKMMTQLNSFDQACHTLIEYMKIDIILRMLSAYSGESINSDGNNAVSILATSSQDSSDNNTDDRKYRWFKRTRSSILSNFIERHEIKYMDRSLILSDMYDRMAPEMQYVIVPVRK